MMFTERQSVIKHFNEEFDPGSGWTLAGRLTHASRTVLRFDLIFFGNEVINIENSGKRASNTYLTCPKVENNGGNAANSQCGHRNENTMIKALCALGGGCGLLDSWWGKSSPSRWWVADLRGCTAAMGLRHGPYSYGRQQWGIFRNGRKPDGAILRGGRRLTGCKLLFWWKTTDGTPRIRDG